jgi:hypothetical protein
VKLSAKIKWNYTRVSIFTIIIRLYYLTLETRSSLSFIFVGNFWNKYSDYVENPLILQELSDFICIEEIRFLAFSSYCFPGNWGYRASKVPFAKDYWCLKHFCIFDTFIIVLINGFGHNFEEVLRRHNVTRDNGTAFSSYNFVWHDPCYIIVTSSVTCWKSSAIISTF